MRHTIHQLSNIANTPSLLDALRRESHSLLSNSLLDLAESGEDMDEVHYLAEKAEARHKLVLDIVEVMKQHQLTL